MAEKNFTEVDIKKLIKDTIEKEFDKVNKSISDIKSEQAKLADEEKIKEIVRGMIVNMYKFFWQKSSNYISKI